MKTLLQSAASVCLVYLLGVSGLEAKELRTVQLQTALGTLEGVESTDGRVRAFKGIPYAAPPVGSLRWKPPQPVQRWEGVRPAIEFGARAMQEHIWDDMFFFDPGPSEDCLYLNVWTPAKDTSAKLPVMVWIHGGGFVAGATSEPRQEGGNLCMKGVVVVSMNYRMGVFGFMAHPELSAESPHGASGNYGLLDMVAALEWVRDNIAGFGGDPRNVTIFGESAGSIAVSALMVSPLAQGLFHKAIGQSGAMIGSGRDTINLKQGEQTAVKFAETHFGTSSLEKLRALPANEILATVWKNAPWGFRPVIDGHFLPDAPAAVYAAGRQSHVPLLAGWNLDEGGFEGFMQGKEPTAENYNARAREMFGANADTFLQVYPAKSPAEVKRAAADYAGDSFIALSTWRWIEVHARNGGSAVYRYRFDQASPLPADAPHGAEPKAAHSWDIEFVFRVLPSKKLPWRPEDFAVSERMASYWTNFAKTGNPNGPGLPEWPAYSSEAEYPVMHLKADGGAAPDLHRARYEFLDRLDTLP
ncbi:MAG TPA: carboxylesterase/lipase family protein [Opitutaceae bacterium]|nr:carboxylesterase/lipase family protein [Opitutaceae bacterium]